MVIDGKIIGKPVIEYYGTQAQIEALTDKKLGMLAYATDIDQIGYFNGTIWTWINPTGGSATPAGTTGDVQYNNAGELAADTGEFSYNPNGLNADGLMKVRAIQSPSADMVNAYLQLGGDTKSNGDGNSLYLFGGNTTDTGTAGGDVYLINGVGGAGGQLGRIKIISADPYTTGPIILNTDNVTTDRTVSFPDKDGTIAYLSDLIASGIDTNAIHTNQSNEISTIAEKTTLTSDDLFIIEDSAAGGIKKKVKQSNLGGAATDSNAIHVNVANEINGITEKITVSGSDWFVIEDSEDSYNKKKIEYSNLVPSGIVHTNRANEFNNISEKTTLTSNDLFIIEDSDANGVKKKVKKSNLGAGGTVAPALNVFLATNFN